MQRSLIFVFIVLGFFSTVACGVITRSFTPTPTSMPTPNLVVLAPTATAISEVAVAPQPTQAQPEVLIPTPTPQSVVAPEPTPSTIPLPDTANLEEVLLLLAAKDKVCDLSANTTSAQKEQALNEIRSSLSDSSVILTGFIQDVRNIMSYDAIISLQKVDTDILFDNLPEDVALTLGRGDYVLVEGRLEIGGCFIYSKVIGELRVLD